MNGLNRVGQAEFPMHPGFFREILLCTKNLLLGLVFRTFLGEFFCLYREGIRGWDENIYRRANYCDGSVHKFSVVAKDTLLRSTGNMNKNFNWRTPRFLALPFTLLMGLLTLPFAIFRTAIKLILMVPRLYILRAEDRLRKPVNLEEMLESLKGMILHQYTRFFIEKTAFPSTNVEMRYIDFQEFVNDNHLPKTLFGPGHFIYMALYHLTFAAALASMPLLLHKFDKLPNIIPHVPTLSLSLGLITLLFISFMALNIRQCLKINRDVNCNALSCYLCNAEKREYYDFERTVNNVLSSEDSIFMEFNANIQKIQDARNRADQNLQEVLIDSATTHLYEALVRKKYEKDNLWDEFPDTMQRALVIFIARDISRHGDNCLPGTAEIKDFGGGLPIIDPYDATTDVGIAAEIALTAPIARILKVIRAGNPLMETTTDAARI